jgi:ABC-2 type transport system permease protein
MSILLGASVLFVLAYQSMGCMLVALTSNLRLASSFAAFYSGPAFAFAGVTYPASGMPMPAWVWSQALPLTHYMNVVTEQTLRGSPVSTTIMPLTALVLFAAIPFAFVLPRMAALTRDQKCWGRQ